jgi:predicted amidohydrolase YtcJ
MPFARGNAGRERALTRCGLASPLALAFSLLLGAGAGSAEEPAGAIRVFVARKIVTMDAAVPVATAVAVEAGRIVGVGSLESLEAALAGREPVVDRSLSDKVLLPGLIDNHLHPSMAALLLPMAFATPYDWSLPSGEVKGVRGREAYRARLSELEAAHGDPAQWLFAWGYHPYFHGELSRAVLDGLSRDRPIIAWHRSFHEIYANSAALAAMNITAEDVAGHPQIDYDDGHFYETGLAVAFQALAPRLLAPEWFGRGLAMVRQAIHRGGITTVADMAAGIFDLETEWSAQRQVFESDATPFRVVLVPDARALGVRLGNREALALIAALPERNTHRLRFVKQVKLFADGAFYSQLMQLGPPGYLDGHHGEWIMQPERLHEAARLYWNAGYQIHVHVNGDRGVDVTLDVLEALQRAAPRDDHRFALHHYGYSTDAQSKRVAALGAVVSANPFYLYALGDKYAEIGLGPERASHMVRLGSLVRHGVPVSLHSDFTMAPAEPLRLAWVAANRVTANGTRMAPGERLSREQALRAITIDAAHLIRMEDEIGSIAPGKRADFTVLEEDPTQVPIERLASLAIWGTVFEGRPYPLEP